MNRADLESFLARAVKAGHLSADEAAALLASFDAGTLAAFELAALPLPASQALMLINAALLAESLAALEDAFGVPLARTVIGTRRTFEIRALESFADEARSLSDRLVSGAVPLADWHADARDLIGRHIARETLLGKGAPLTASEMRAAQSLADEQAAYLLRFAEEASARALQGRPFSNRQLASRLGQYAGAGRALYFRQAERRYQGQPGWVVDYIDRDDSATCSPCRAAAEAGPYLPTKGPMPGAVCRARGLCRCARTPRLDPAAYSRLALV